MSAVIPLRRKPPEWTLGDRLRKMRRELGLSQEAFALLVGATDASIGAYESGTRTPRSPELIKLARRIERTTGYPADWIVMGDGTPDDDTPTSQRPQMDSNHRPTAYKSHDAPRGDLKLVA